ncbi:SagB/ThcOx family dehydrogenase [Ureibacillus sp. MALMAid1270]|uniref:SagB/ThcOx family dehydrogenase n=1 Tax=Ureibacillus sp. MALMAid1270 TaxID=3411629 RepID=UPI003BA7402E
MKDYYTYEYYLMNSNNYESQLLHAPGREYSSIPVSKSYASHPNDIIFEICNEKLISSVRSTRETTEKKMELRNVFRILHTSYLLEKEDNDFHSYNPSAGGLYPIEFYVFLLNIDNVKSAIYHYHREKGILSYIREIDLDFIPETNKFVTKSNFFIVMTGKVDNILFKYGSRGYRYLLIEAGHIGQNLKIVSDYLNIKNRAIGGFYEKKLVDILQLPKTEIPLYLYCFMDIE